MHIWILAAAAGAGYLAYILPIVPVNRALIFRKSVKEKPSFMRTFDENLTQEDPNFKEMNNGDPGCLFCSQINHQLSRSTFPVQDKISVAFNGKLPDVLQVDLLTANRRASNTHDEDITKGDLDLFAEMSEFELESNQNKQQPEGFLTAIRKVNAFCKGSVFKCCNWYYSVKHITSLESCLFALMHRKHQQMEGHISSKDHLLSNPNMMPIFLANKTQAITPVTIKVSSAPSEGMCLGLQSESAPCSRKTVRLREIRPYFEGSVLGLSRDARRQRRNGLHDKSSIANIGPTENTPISHGSFDAPTAFCFGIAFGMVFTLMSNKRQMDNLNELLNQSGNLVRDLQEELEMKDSLTREELTNESLVPQMRYLHSVSTNAGVKNASPIAVTLGLEPELPRLGFSGDAAPPQCRLPYLSERKWVEDLNIGNEVKEHVESLSKIEAELEAELERMDTNVEDCSLFSGFSETDSDFVADIVHGNLGLDVTNMAHELDSASWPPTNREMTSNFALSPKELSLRLYEVVQSRLEEHISELETELEYTKRRLQLVVDEKCNQTDVLLTSENGQLSVQKSISTVNSETFVVSNSSSHVSVHTDTQVVEMPELVTTSMQNLIDDTSTHPLDRCLGLLQREGNKNIATSLVLNGDSDSGNFSEDGMPRGCRRYVADVDEPEEEDVEVENTLLRQIREKTKQGSPAAMHFRRMLRSLDTPLE